MSTTTAVRERPIIFSGPMIRAIIEGRKTQTRRPVTMPGWSTVDGYSPRAIRRIWDGLGWNDVYVDPGGADIFVPGPYLKVAFPAEGSRHRVRCVYQPGDALWVREKWGADHWYYIKQYQAETWRGTPDPSSAGIHYAASERDLGIFPAGYWRSPIHMPRWASRITLEIESVRVERVQEISEADAEAEGCRAGVYQGRNRAGEPCEVRQSSAIEAYAQLWNSLHGHGAWDRNDWVWALTFRRLEAR